MVRKVASVSRLSLDSSLLGPCSSINKRCQPRQTLCSKCLQVVYQNFLLQAKSELKLRPVSYFYLGLYLHFMTMDCMVSLNWWKLRTQFKFCSLFPLSINQPVTKKIWFLSIHHMIYIFVDRLIDLLLFSEGNLIKYFSHKRWQSTTWWIFKSSEGHAGHRQAKR